MNYSELEQGTLIKTPDGIGIFMKVGVRQVLDVSSGYNLEKVALVLIDNETRWYDLKDISILD